MVRTSVEMFEEGLISARRPCCASSRTCWNSCWSRASTRSFKGKPLAQGLPASPGAASGKCVRRRPGRDARQAGRENHPGPRGNQAGRHPRLLPGAGHPHQPRRQDLPRRGGGPRHGQTLRLRLRRHHRRLGEAQARCRRPRCQEGDIITIDGGTGHVYARRSADGGGRIPEEMATLLGWADEMARLEVMANADTPETRRARAFGAMGIGLCRTERMFNEPTVCPSCTEMILAETPEERQRCARPPAADPALGLQGHLQGHEGLPVTIRLLDPPMHEFLPTRAQLELEIAHLHQLRDTIKRPGRTAGHAEAAQSQALPAICRRPDQAARA